MALLRSSHAVRTLACSLLLALGAVPGAASADHTRNHDFPEANEPCPTGMHDGSVPLDGRGALCADTDGDTFADVYAGGELDANHGWAPVWCGELWIDGTKVSDTDDVDHNATAC